MALWELLAYLDGKAEQQAQKLKLQERQAVLVGCYAGHYVNGGRKAKPPAYFIERIMGGEESEALSDEDAQGIWDRIKAGGDR